LSDVTDRRASDAHRTFAIMLAGFCAFLDLYATQPLLPMLARIFDASAVRVSLTVTLATAAVALAAPFAGTISDRIGRKRTIVWSSVALGFFTAFAAFSPTLNWLLFWRFLQGVFTPGIFAVTIAYIHDEWRGTESGRATAAYVSGTVVGGFSGRFLSGFVATHMSWQWVFVMLGVLNLCGAAAMAQWLPRERRAVVRGPLGGWPAALIHLQNPQLLATFAVGFCVLFAMTAAFTYVTFYLAAPPFGLRPASLGSLFFVYLIGAVITPASGRWIDHYGQRAALAVAIGAAVAGILLTLVQDLRAVIAGLAICCTGVFVAQASASSYIGLATKHNRALAVGLYATFYYAGGSAGAALPGFLWQRGGWPACVALIAAVQVVTVGLALALWSSKPASAAA
jgi:MFS transporter, YNFM family, putative membrane transport protein